MRAELTRRAETSLAAFCRQAWEVLEPNTRLEWNWHLDAICLHVQAVLEGWMNVMAARMAGRPDPPQKIKNLVVNVPPGSGKSRLVSVFAPAWMWLRWPSWRAIFVSGNPRVALRDADYSRALIESDWYRGRFCPDWTLAKDQNAKSLYRNTAGGLRMSISAGSRITGDRADALFVDDPNDAAEVHSAACRDAVNDWWDHGAANRVNDLRCSTRVLIQQRFHEQDLTGHATGDWEKLVIPQEYDPAIARETVLGWRDPRSCEGELMFPARFTPEVVAVEKNRLGAVGYAGQHQQRPVPAGGNLFRLEWFDDVVLRPPPLKRVVRAWDLAASEEGAGRDPDWTVGVKMGIGHDQNFYILDVKRLRASPAGVEKVVVATARADGTDVTVRIPQDPGSAGKALLWHYQRDLLDGYAVRGLPVTGDKVTRAHPLSSAAECRRVKLVRGEWCSDFLAELAMFPKGSHDDQVDAAVDAHAELTQSVVSGFDTLDPGLVLTATN